MITKIKCFFGSFIASIKGFKSNPLESLGGLLPVATCVTSIIGFIFSYCIFIAQGHYSEHIAYIAENGIFNLSPNFTGGTISIMTSGIVAVILLAILLANIIVILITFFCHSGKVKKIVMIGVLAATAISAGLSTILMWIMSGRLTISQVAAEKISAKLDEMHITLNEIITIIFAMTIVMLLIYLVLILTAKECRIMVKKTALALVFANIALPLLLLLLQNIVLLFSAVVSIAAVAGVIFFIFASIGSNSDTSQSDKSDANSATQKAIKPSNQKEQRYSLDTIFWRGAGGNGIFVPLADCIYFNNAYKEKTYACTVYDYEKGTVAIINKNKRITNIAGCNTPQK